MRIFDKKSAKLNGKNSRANTPNFANYVTSFSPGAKENQSTASQKFTATRKKPAHNFAKPTPKARDFEAAEFRRGVALGGGFSVHDADHRKKLLREKQRELKRWRRILATIFVATLIIIALVLVILNQFQSSVSVSQKQGDLILDKKDRAKYEKIINEYFASRPLERFSFSYNQENLNEFVTNRAPEIFSVRVSASGLMRGAAELNLREPVAMWRISGATNYVDARGIVFQKNYFSTPTLAIEDQFGAKEVDGMIASARFLGFVGQVAAEVDQKLPQNEIARIVIPATAVRYAEIYLTGKSYPIKIQIDREPRDQAADVVAAVRYLEQRKISPKYIDARVSGKAYWR